MFVNSKQNLLEYFFTFIVSLQEMAVYLRNMLMLDVQLKY